MPAIPARDRVVRPRSRVRSRHRPVRLGQGFLRGWPSYIRGTPVLPRFPCLFALARGRALVAGWTVSSIFYHGTDVGSPLKHPLNGPVAERVLTADVSWRFLLSILVW